MYNFYCFNFREDKIPIPAACLIPGYSGPAREDHIIKSRKTHGNTS